MASHWLLIGILIQPIWLLTRTLRTITAQLAEFRETGGQDWWGLVTAGLVFWAAILTVALFIICIVLCVDHKTSKSTNRYADSYSGSSSDMYHRWFFSLCVLCIRALYSIHTSIHNCDTVLTSNDSIIWTYASIIF